EIDSAPGSINRMSIAVLLDSSKVTAAQLAQWTNVVSTAANINNARGDEVNVRLVPFDTTAAKAAAASTKNAQSAQSQNFLLNLLRYVVTLLIVALVLFFAWRSVKRAGVLSGPVRVPLDLRELEAGELLSRLDQSYQRNQLPDPRATRPAIDVRSPIESDLNDLIERQPDEVAQTLRSWLADRRS